MKILVLNGPNLNLLGVREPGIYGSSTYADLVALITARARELGIEADCRQSNHEGVLVDWIQEARGVFDGIVINPAAYTHTSVAILDALKAVALPAVEVHISDVDAREEFRRHSFVSPACIRTIKGMGFEGYALALRVLAAFCAGLDGVRLVPACLSDAEALWKLQREAFAALLEKYRDYDTNPAAEPLEKTVRRLAMAGTSYYFITMDGERVGTLRVIDKRDGSPKRVSPICVSGAARGRQVATRAMRIAEAIHGDTGWELETIAQEPGNRHLYEKLGYTLFGEEERINERMSLVHYRK